MLVEIGDLSLIYPLKMEISQPASFEITRSSGLRGFISKWISQGFWDCHYHNAIYEKIILSPHSPAHLKTFKNSVCRNCLFYFLDKTPVAKCVPHFLLLSPSTPPLCSINQHSPPLFQWLFLWFAHVSYGCHDFFNVLPWFSHEFHMFPLCSCFFSTVFPIGFPVFIWL